MTVDQAWNCDFMVNKLNIPYGIVIVGLALGLNFAPLVMSRLGGSWTILILVACGIFCVRYRPRDLPFKMALEKVVPNNAGMIVCLTIYYVMVIVAAIRWEFAWATESHVGKAHIMNLVGLVLGFFFVANKQYNRWIIYCSVPFLLYSTYYLNIYVDITGESAKMALSELEGALGSSSNWQIFGMQIFLLLGVWLDEKNKVLKFFGTVILLVLYRAILLCGFATPIGLMIIAHAVLGSIFLFFAKPSKYALILKVVISVALVTGAVYAFFAIGEMDEKDKRYADIQYRFKHLREDWRGGGYDYDAGQSRLELKDISIAQFKQAPWFGVGGVYQTHNKHSTGGHQSLFDFFAIYGVVGGGAYVFFVLLCLKNALLRYRREQSWFAASQIGLVVMFVVGGMVNPGWVGMPVTILFLYGQPFALSHSLQMRLRQATWTNARKGQLNRQFHQETFAVQTNVRAGEFK